MKSLLPEAALAVVLLATPFIFIHLGFSYDLMERVLDWGILGIGFDLLFGWTGLLSFGQAAFYGTGGFVTAWLLLSGGMHSVWLALALGTIAAGFAGLFVGWFAVRRIGIYFAMITLAFGQMAFFIENNPLSDYTGGENGLPGVPVPTVGWGSWAFRVETGQPMYWALAAFFLASFILGRRIIHSPFGVVLRAIKQNTVRAAMVGHAVPRYKLAAFVIAALFAGLAGGLLGVLQSFMPPDAFTLDTSGQLVVQTVIGGVGTLVGPAVGATVWLWLRDNLQLIPGIGPLWKLILGVVFVVLVIALRRGICGEIRAAWQRRRHVLIAAAPPRPIAVPQTIPLAAPQVLVRQDAPALQTHDLARHYGGLRAVDGVSFDVRSRSVHAVIGPNGAGKSTLFKMLLDEVQPSEGEVLLYGRRITGLGATRTAQLGIGKSNQLNHLFLELTPRENLRIAALARKRGSFRLDMLRRADSIAEVEWQIDAVLATMELSDRADVPAHILAYGEKRRLEIGLALATGPHVLLLDEPLAGMSPAERTSTRSLIRTIGRDRTLVIVEHDMDAVFELAERITVLYEGRMLAEGSPDEIQRNQAVQDAYLGGLREHEPA
jgi:branched-chain amino acid transport system permease protein